MLCYRIVKPAYADKGLSGEGARLYGGRWNPPGLPCIYAAGSRALAALEMLVHLSGAARRIPYVTLVLDVPEDEVEEISLPRGWDSIPPGRPSQDAGAAWLKKNHKIGLRIPSVFIPEEMNVVLNPNAPGFEQIRIRGEERLRFDARL